MVEVNIPGIKILRFEHIVMNFNGTLAFDNKLIPGVREVIKKMKDRLAIHILTEITTEYAQKELEGISPDITFLPLHHMDKEKLSYIRTLGTSSVICIGNGDDDLAMLEEVGLGIAIIHEKDTSINVMLAADIICSDIFSVLELLMDPQRIIEALKP